MSGEHRTPPRWAPGRVAGLAGFLLLSHAVVAAAAGWLGWWRSALGVAFVLFQFAVVLLAWAHGYTTCEETDP